MKNCKAIKLDRTFDGKVIINANGLGHSTLANIDILEYLNIDYEIFFGAPKGTVELIIEKSISSKNVHTDNLKRIISNVNRVYYDPNISIRDFVKHNPKSVFINYNSSGIKKDWLNQQTHISLDQFWSTDLGWLPWKDNNYYVRGSKGPWSLDANCDESVFESHNPMRGFFLKREIKDNFRKRFKSEKNPEHEDYILVTLQNDREGRLRASPFESQRTFFEFIRDLFSQFDRKIYIKQHPKTKISWFDIPDHPQLVDVTEPTYNKDYLYKEAAAVVTQNSTTALEGLVYDKPVFTYADEIFSNKSVTFEKIYDGDQIGEILNRPLSDERIERINKFLSFLVSRQINRRACFKPNPSYYYEYHPLFKKIQNTLEKLK